VTPSRPRRGLTCCSLAQSSTVRLPPCQMRKCGHGVLDPALDLFCGPIAGYQGQTSNAVSRHTRAATCATAR